MATFIHFDISANDPERARKFYSQIFGWKFEQLPGPAGYHLIETSGLDGAKGIGGGMSKREGRQSGMINYIGVASVDESCKQITGLGGKIVQPKQALPGWGYLALCLDTEDNLFGIFEEEKKFL